MQMKLCEAVKVSSMKLVFLVKQWLDAVIVFMKPLLVFSGGRAHYFQGNSVDSIMERYLTNFECWMILLSN